MPLYPFGNVSKEKGKKCQYGNCTEIATHCCKMCHILICERHTRKPGLLGNSFSIKLCPDCFKLHEEKKMKRKE